MNRDEFTQLMTDKHDDLIRINQTKGVEYAGEEDALDNFKRIAATLDLRPEQARRVSYSTASGAVDIVDDLGQSDYERQVEERAGLILSEYQGGSYPEAMPEHARGECVECDALRLLADLRHNR